MPRKKTFQTFREARKLGAYAEMPMLPEETQVQVRLSRNDRAQPFYALFAKDTLLLLLSGAGNVEFRGAPVRAFGLQPGDCVYVPAGMAHRLVHSEESVVLRYVPQAPLVEGVAWFCEACARELHREVWSSGERFSQDAYAGASARFNADARHRTCTGCATVHPAVEATAFGWEDAARQLRQA